MLIVVAGGGAGEPTYPALLPYTATLYCYLTLLPYSYLTIPCTATLHCYLALLPYTVALHCYFTMLLYTATTATLHCYLTLLPYTATLHCYHCNLTLLLYTATFHCYLSEQPCYLLSYEFDFYLIFSVITLVLFPTATLIWSNRKNPFCKMHLMNSCWYNIYSSEYCSEYIYT